jgi:dipeptidyl aminopeptidase/acylaminoacyl peptidase
MDNEAKVSLSIFNFGDNLMKKIFLFIALLAFCLPVFAQKAANHTIQQYLSIRSASSPALSDDGKRMFYLTNVSGTSQIWTVDLPKGTPKQLTNFEDNVSFVRWGAKNGSEEGLIFGKAIGGNENTQFFWMKPDGSNVRELTNAPQIRHNFGELSKDGKTIYYTSNKRDRNWFDVYRMDIASGKEEMIFEQDGSNSVAAVSDDGSKIIVSRSSVKFSLDNDLYLIDAKTKEATHLTPHTEAALYSDVHFAPDGNSIIFGTNQNGEFITLSRMDLASKKISPVSKANWDLDATAFSDDGKMFAYTLNREGFSDFFIALTASMNKEIPIKLPAQGIVGGMDFSKDGRQLAFTFSSAKNNADIWLYDLPSKTVTQITRSDRAGIPQESFVEPKLIKFKSFDGREIPAWYYIPANINGIRIKGKLDSPESAAFSLYKSDTPQLTTASTVRFAEFTVSDSPHSGPLPASSLRSAKTVPTDSPKITSVKVPVIVSVHGGPEGQERPGFNPLYQYYLSRGYSVLATNVRGSTGYGKTFSHLDDVEKREDSVKDLAAAVEWLKTSGGADPKKVAVMGGSYGGYMTMAAITLYPELWAAAVNTVGIVNWETFLKNTSGYRRRQREVEYGMLDKDIDFLRKISPIAKVDRIKTPLFVIHGKNDPRVPYTEAEQIVEVLRKRGATVEYKLFDDEGHGISKLKNRLELYPLVADFLDKYMK